jgi:periplasmic protein TonB
VARSWQLTALWNCAMQSICIKNYAMTTQNILTADVLDIVFENRNKAYGAYALRKYYDKRLMNSMGIMLLIVTAFILLSFRFGKKPSLHVVTDKGIVTVIDLKPSPPDEPKKPEKKIEKAVKESKLVESVKATSKIDIVPDNKVLPDDIVPDQSQMENKLVNIVTSDGEKFTGQAVKSDEKNKGNGGDIIPDEEPMDPNNPIDNADEPPTYPGGIEALQNFLRRNLRTPDELESGESASVKIKFVVSADGEMHTFEIIQSAGNAFDNEVMRVLKKMPKWNPGKYKGQPVSVYYVIPVKFEAIEE